MYMTLIYSSDYGIMSALSCDKRYMLSLRF